MMTNLFLISIPNSVSRPLMILPIVFAIVAWVMNIRRVRSGKAAGIIFNGDAWVKWLFLLFVAIILLQVGSWFLPKDWTWFAILKKDMSLQQKLVIPVVTAVYFLCYFFIAFRPATEEELREAKSAKQLAVSFVSDAAGAAAGAAGAAGTAATGLLALIGSMLYPIVMVGGQTFVYLGVGAAGFFTSMIALIPIVVIMAMLGTFVVLVVTFLTFAVMIFASILKFVSNLRFHFR
ncbi:MAG: hypothetical protein IJ710_04625 [Prevotella sp.]|nr:hypothetical protein [Prevotella sp.]